MFFKTEIFSYPSLKLLLSLWRDKNTYSYFKDSIGLTFEALIEG